ncbi:MAG: GTP-binding protein, partial [Alcanivoracaceae bacterium]|nr:GTP-binding protein [Alcanivoracaceae bacterium]
MNADQLPVFVLTGFLGSGKTTLLNALLPHYPDSALVINELGNIGIDDQLIEDRSVPVTLL